MDRIQNLIKQGLVIYGAVKPAMNRYYLVLLGLALGMLIGVLVVPVYFRPNAEPVKMDETYRDQWIKDTANGFQFVTNFADSGLVENPDQLRASAENEVRTKLTAVGATPAEIDALIAENDGQVYLEQSLVAIRPYAVEVESAASEQQESAEIPGSLTRLLTTLGIFALFGVLGAVITLVFKLFDIPFLKQIMNIINPKEEDPSMAAAKARKAAREQAAGLRSQFDRPPVSQFMSTYLSGDNYYDDSFAIELEDENKTFLGECGSGISESITIEGTKHVVATEVWLFDKNDISTITKLLVSEAAYNDPETRAKLAPRGDLIVAQEGERLIFETQTLKMQASVVSMNYGNAGEPNQVFDKLTVELAVWQKEGVDVGDDNGMPTPVIDVDAFLAQQEAQQQQAPPTAPPQQPQQPVSPPPQRQQTQPVPQQQPPTGPSPAQQPPQQRPPQQQGLRQPGPPPQQPPQQRPPQQRPPQRPPQQPPQQRPPQQQGSGQRPPMPPQQQAGPRPQFPAQQQGQRPPIQQQGSGQRPPMPPQQRRQQDDSPFGDTGDFNLQ